MAEELEALINNDEAIAQISKIAFDKFDTDKSGEIDVNELEAVMKDVSKDLKIDPPSKDEVKQFLDMLDTDKSGKIDVKEFSAFIKLILKAALEALKEQK